MTVWVLEQVTRLGDREENQDYALSWRQDDAIVAVVADGLGGHQGGALASSLFCQGLHDCSAAYVGPLLAAQADDLKALAADWLNAAANAMRLAVRASSDTLAPLTTCAVAVLQGVDLVTVHVGDSRIYRIAPDGIRWRSRDHSVVQMLLDDGEITESEMGTHPEQGRLLRAIGMQGEVRPAVRRHAPLGADEAVLLCSDGFWEHVTQTEICALATGAATELDRLADLAVARAAGKSDNVTAQLLQAERDTEA